MNNIDPQSFASTDTQSGHIIGNSGLYTRKMMVPPYDPSVDDVIGLHSLLTCIEGVVAQSNYHSYHQTNHTRTPLPLSSTIWRVWSVIDFDLRKFAPDVTNGDRVIMDSLNSELS